MVVKLRSLLLAVEEAGRAEHARESPFDRLFGPLSGRLGRPHERHHRRDLLAADRPPPGPRREGMDHCFRPVAAIGLGAENLLVAPRRPLRFERPFDHKLRESDLR